MKRKEPLMAAPVKRDDRNDSSQRRKANEKRSGLTYDASDLPDSTNPICDTCADGDGDILM